MSAMSPFQIPDEFAQTGLHVEMCHPSPPTQFQVLGERGSGTNFVRKLVDRNIAMKRTEALGWKHGPVHSAAIPSNFLVICVVRDARAWALSMHKRPWHGHPRLQHLGFGDFLRSPWEGIVDRPADFEELHPELDAQDAILQFDRHPVTGMPFENLFALRRSKLEGLMGIANRGANVAYIRFESLMADPGWFMEELRNRIGVGANFKAAQEGLRMPPDRRMGNQFNDTVENRPDTPKSFPPEDLEFLKAELDLELESRLGFTY